MKTIVQKQNSPSHELIQYLPDSRVKIDLENILTIDRIIYPNMLLLKLEGRYSDVIRVIDVWDYDGYVHLLVEDRKTGKTGELVQILDKENKIFIWSLISLDYVLNVLEDRIANKINNGELLDFDF